MNETRTRSSIVELALSAPPTFDVLFYHHYVQQAPFSCGDCVGSTWCVLSLHVEVSTRLTSPTAHIGPEFEASEEQLVARNHFAKRCASASGAIFAQRKAKRATELAKRWTPHNDTIQNTTCILDQDVTPSVHGSLTLSSLYRLLNLGCGTVAPTSLTVI